MVKIEELTNEELEKLDSNTNKIKGWLTENAYKFEGVLVEYDNCCLHVYPNAREITFSCCGFSKKIDSLKFDEKLFLIENWAHFKNEFILEKARLISERKATHDLIKNFEV